MSGMIISVYLGKRERYNGEITVKEPDSCGDVYLSVRDAGSDDFGIYMRPNDARRLARVLLQVTEEGE